VIKIVILAAALLAQSLAHNSPTILNQSQKELDARNERDASKPGGGVYEGNVTGKLIDEIGILRKCEPNMLVRYEPYSLYIDIAADGKVKAIRFIPEPSSAACIRKAVIGYRFPPFEGGFLTKLMVSIQ
jgi:hypothetical protein